MNSGNHPKVSVAIPVYNGADHIEEAIASARAQTVPVDVRVFDNASTDDTVKLAASLLGDDAITGAESNLGAAENFNRAVRSTDGDYFAWLAHDDRLKPEFVEVCLRVLEQQPDAPACLPAIQFTDSHGAPTRVQTDEPLSSPDARVRLRSFLRRRRWTETYCLYRREWLERSPLFAPENAADVRLTWWFLLRAPIAVTPEPLFEYREYPLTSVADTTDKASSALPDSPVKVRWKKARMWTRLRKMTYADDIDPKTAKAARRELFLLATWPGVLFWVLEDVLDRWPAVDRALRGIWKRLGAPGGIAPLS